MSGSYGSSRLKATGWLAAASGLQRGQGRRPSAIASAGDANTIRFAA